MAKREHEWESNDPFARLIVPAERLATQRYKFSAPNGVGLSGTCADFLIEPNHVRLKDVLIDTSERYQGTVLKQRVTHRTWLVLAHTAVVLYSLHQDELEDAEPAEVERT